VVKSSLNTLAFTLIEVLFAIVIMGITMVSVPVIMSSNARGFDTTIIQEAIFAASAELNQALSFNWDENSMENNSTAFSRVIDTTGDCDNATRLRPGHIKQPFHRRCIDSNTTMPTLGNDGDMDDIDDINLTKKNMFLNDSTTQSGYKHAYQSEFNIRFADIGNVTTASQNAKLVEIIVQNDNDENVTVLRSYTLNIGEVDFYKRTY